MKPKTIILMVVAIGCGLVASVMTSQLIADRSGEPQEKRVKVLVAKTKVKAFDLIKEPEKLFVEKEMPESAVPKKALRTLADVKDKRPLRALPEDSLVSPDDLVNKDLNGLSAQLQPGTRAVAIRVSPESLAGGFVLPASRVDIMHTLRRGDNMVTSTILQNMLVLAVDMNPAADPERQAMLGSTVTLSARPEEAQRLTVASLTGELRLSLRPVGEDKQLTIKGSSVEDLTRPLGDTPEHSAEANKPKEEPTSLANLIPPLPPLPPPPAVEPKEEPRVETPQPTPQPRVATPPPVKKHTLTLIQGDQVQKVTFIKGGKEEENGETPPAPEPAPQPSPEPAPSIKKEPAPAGKSVTTPVKAPGVSLTRNVPTPPIGTRE